CGYGCGNGSFCVLVIPFPKFQSHEFIFPVLVFLKDAESSGQIIFVASKAALTSSSKTIVTKDESVHTPFDTESLIGNCPVAANTLTGFCCVLNVFPFNVQFHCVMPFVDGPVKC